MISLAYTLKSTESGAPSPRHRSLPVWQMVTLFALVAAIRLPFLHNTPGPEAAFGEAARRWLQEGSAEPFPWALAPAYQFLCVLLWPVGAWAANVVSVLASGWAAVGFAILVRRGGAPWAAPAGFILSMIPQFWSVSHSTSPLVPALALGLAALVAADSGRAGTSGVFLGFAWLTHPSALAFLLAAFVLHLGCRRYPIARNAIHGAVCLLVAIALSVLLHWALRTWFGVGLFQDMSRLFPAMDQPNAAGEFTLQTLIGPTGQALLLVTLGLIVTAFRQMGRPNQPARPIDWSVPGALLLLLAGAVVLQLCFLPWLGSVLMIFPALVYLAVAWADGRLLVLAALVLLISPWIALEGTHLARSPVPWINSPAATPAPRPHKY